MFVPIEDLNGDSVKPSRHIAAYCYGIVQDIMLCSYVCVQSGITPLHTASEEGHTKVVDTLLRRGADPNLATTV